MGKKIINFWWKESTFFGGVWPELYSIKRRDYKFLHDPILLFTSRWYCRVVGAAS